MTKPKTKPKAATRSTARKTAKPASRKGSAPTAAGPNTKHARIIAMEEGDIAVRLSTRTGAAQDGYFSLGGLKMVREKVAAACKWPHAVDRPRN
jgi:hypothetical protein